MAGIRKPMMTSPLSAGVRLLVLVVLASGFFFRAEAENFVVTTTGDDGDGSLRMAVLNANARPGPDRIIFSIPGDGVHTIRLLTMLPAITDSVEADGYSQPGAKPSTLTNGDNAELRIQLDGNARS